MRPIQKLNFFFNQKSRFENEITMCGFRLSKGLQEDFKDLKKSGEIEKSLLKKYKFICSEDHFSKSVKQLLSEIENEINDKVNIVAEANLKSEFLFSSIQQLSELIEKIEQLAEQYPKINLEKLEEKSKLFFKLLNFDTDEQSILRISDDMIEEMVALGEKMSIAQVPQNILTELLDDEYSDIYKNCLIRASAETTNTISRIILENQHLLSENYNFSKSSPFLIPSEQPRQIPNKTKPVQYTANEYALAYIFDLYANGEQVPINRAEGTYNAKKIKEDSTLFNSYLKSPDGFYRAVKKVLTFDVNKSADLQNISKDWQNSVKALSNNWTITQQYLKNKKLIKE